MQQKFHFSRLHLQNDESCSQIRVKVIAGKSLAKKDIFGASDPYVRIDLNTINGDGNIDSVLTKTKKKVFLRNPPYFHCHQLLIDRILITDSFSDTQSAVE